MRITAAEARRQHWICVTLDDGEALIDKTVWLHSGLSVGDELSAMQWESLLETSAAHRAREKALYYLSLRDYGSGELVKKLCQGGIERERAVAAVARLVESGLINDERYACALARDMSGRKLYPKRRIAMALREKGFSPEIVETAVLQLPEEEEQQALELLRKKRYNDCGDGKQRDKALAMLARFGFSYAVSKRALALYEEETKDD